MTASGPRDAFTDHFTTQTNVGARAVRLTGELDGDTAPLLLAAVERFLAEVPGELTLDVGGLIFADSALLNSIVKIQTGKHGDCTVLRLINQPAAIKRLLLAAGATVLLTTGQ